jgi:hypothetical protein
VPTLVLDLALFVPRRKVGAYARFKKLASLVADLLIIFRFLLGLIRLDVVRFGCSMDSTYLCTF